MKIQNQYNRFKIILLILLFFSFSIPVIAQKKENSVLNTGGDYRSRSTNKKARRGGRNTLPVGIDGKKINIGIGTGIAIPGLSMQTEEHTTIGNNSHLYAHYLFNTSSTIGLGINANFIALNTNNSKFYDENQNLTVAKSSSWSFFTLGPSFLLNYTIKPRISTQLIINGGAMWAVVPNNNLAFTDSIQQIGEPTKVEYHDYYYVSGTELGWFLSGTFQFNFALTHNLEARVGVDYFYGRFSYGRFDKKDVTLKVTNQLRELKLVDIFAGLAISF
jgi:hypothetical protein